ncbi:MAG: hypothetical protein AMXMBFR84_28140 [Candidatus Hydrogenedentota bacterium]
MAFAQPIALALFALFIPVILLYLLKQRRRRVMVSNLLFWEKVLRDEHTITSFTRIRKLLSLLLQLLIVSLLALAVAQPLLSGGALGARRIVLILDRSASMTAVENGMTRFDKAKQLAQNVIRGMGQGDNLMLVTIADQADIVSPFTNGRKDLLDALDRVELTHGGTRFDKALSILDNLPKDERDTHVYVISDGAFDPVTFTPAENTQFAYLKVGEAKDNVGIAAFQLRALPASPRDFEIYFEAVNHTESEKRIPYEVNAAGILVDAGELVLAAGASEVRTVRQFSNEGGEVDLFLDYDDAYPIDNRAYGVLPEPRVIPVTLVSEGNLFLESALRTDDEIDLTMTLPANYSADPVEGDHVMIFDRWAPPATPKGIAVFLSAWPADLGLSSNGPLADAIITEWDEEHPINRHVSLTNVTIRSALKVNCPDEFTPLISAFDDPLALIRSTTDSQTLVFAFDENASDLPLRVAYPILVANAVRYMAGIDSDPAWQTPPIGQMLSADDLRGFVSKHTAHADDVISSVSQSQSATGPAESQMPLAPLSDDALLPVNRSGVYRATMTDGEQIPLFAANINSARESNIAPSHELPIQSDAPLPVIAGGLRLGTEPWLILAALAFAVLTAEWWLFHRRIVE